MAVTRRIDAHSHPVRLALSPEDNESLANLCGPFDRHLRVIELGLGVAIHNRGHVFELIGPPGNAERARALIERLYRQAASEVLDEARVQGAVHEVSEGPGVAVEVELSIRTKRGLIRARGGNQQRYLEAMRGHDLSFGIGPAGTGKTYLAVAMAVDALEQHRVQRLVLVRPAVEAGEKLGFLPGDLVQKVDPYLRPLYDALYEMLGPERVLKLIERNVIEVAPLAFMRGRTLNDAFIILDEAQNTTIEQMKMFLTRIGFGAKAVVTGDLTQIDLPRKELSGLRHAIDVLRAVEGVSFTFFEARDVVRHPLVQRIVRAYESFEAKPARE